MVATVEEAQGGEPVRRLEEAVREAGSASAWARLHGLSPAYVSDVRLGRRLPGPSVLAALGLARVVTYVETEARR